MHKIFYARGFLFHSSSQQILLQQQILPSSTLVSPWSLFNGLYKEDDKPEEVFKNVIFNLLRIKIGTIYPVYSYHNESTKTNQVIMYALLKKQQDFLPTNEATFSWFSFKEILKLPMTEQMRHDIIVGQRVIAASERKSRGEHTIQ